MSSDDMMGRQGALQFALDGLDLQILELLLADATTSFKKMALLIGVDQRTIAKRIDIMRVHGVFKLTVDINWPRIGVNAHAYVGTATALGEKEQAKFFDLLRREPRIVEAYVTLGAHEYVLKVLGRNFDFMRRDVLRRFEPVTAGLSTSIVTSEAKPKDYSTLLRFLREQKGFVKPYPGTRLHRT